MVELSTAGVRFELVPLTGRTKHRDARGAVDDRRGLLVRAHAGGRVGLGEASPLPGHSDETLASCADALAGEVRDLRLLPPAARFAVETALLDLEAQARGVPLFSLLGASAAPVRTQALVTLDETAEDAVRRGARALKLKLGAPDDVERIEAARSLGDALVLRADANERALSPRVVDALVAARFDFCEDPCPIHALAPMPFAVAIDVRRRREAAALDAVERGLASVLVLKPTVLGGLRAVLDLAARGRSLGARIVVSHALESPIGLAAAAHLAIATGVGEIHGLAPHAGIGSFVADGPVEVRSFVQPFAIGVPTVPGLG